MTTENKIIDGDVFTELDINSYSSVQPNILLRTPVFTPSSRRSQTTGRKADIDELRELKFSRSEGYEQVSILGSRLSIETDFRVWCGIIKVFKDHGYTHRDIKLPFTEFAKHCGFRSKQISKPLKERIDGSLKRIMTQVLSFTKNNGKKTDHYHLIANAGYDIDENIIYLKPDEDLWELYNIDYTTLLGLGVMDLLTRQETAACLYTFIQSLPKNPAPVSFTRLRARLNLSGLEKEQNRSIKAALERLMEIGYLKGEIRTRLGERYLFIDERDPWLGRRKKLKLIKQDDPDAQEDDDCNDKAQ